MQVKTIVLAAALSMGPSLLHAQFDFRVGDRNVQVHSFASQGYMYSNVNNYMTMKTSQGSFAMTDGGVNASVQLTDKFRVGGQVYVRDFGRMGDWHPQLDWGYADYRFKDWFGVRGGKVKTELGLFNNTQDNDSLHTFALLPQSVYPTDLRDSTISHIGGDAYGNIPIKHLGSFSYDVFVGDRRDTKYGGYSLMVQDRGITIDNYGGLQYGGDLKWTTPLKGLLVGGSHLIEVVTGTGQTTCTQSKASVDCAMWTAKTNGNYEEYSKKAYSNYFYGDYSIGNLRLDTEYRRYWRDQAVWNGLWAVWSDTRGYYSSAAYRFSKRIEIGGYYSRFTCSWVSGGIGPKGPTTKPPSLNTSLPANHIYDKVATLRFDITKYWNIKVEGHFMDGYGTNQSPDGFYDTSNTQGYKPKTNLLLIRTGWSF